MFKGVILAAGIGKRMKSSTPKVLHKIFGYPILYYPIKTLLNAGLKPSNLFIVVGRNREIYEKSVKISNVNFVIQDEPLGTGDATKRILPYIEDSDDVLVMPSDVPLIEKDTIIKAKEFFKEKRAHILILTSILENPSPYGRVVREGEKIVGIKEDRDLKDDEREIKEINSGIYIFKGEILKKYLPLIKNENAQREYYLTDVVGLAANDGNRIISMPVSFEEIIGINTRRDLREVFKIMKERKINELEESGVTIFDPSTTFISPFVKAGRDTIFYPGVYIEGEFEFGEGCVIGPFVRIDAVKEKVIVKDSVIIGPFASIREGTKLMKKSKAKTFVEIKKSTVGEESAVPHLSYIGDATIGKNVNIGAGTITCNYDGKKKHPTIIEDDVFIGSDSILVAKEGGLFIRRGAYTGAGSVITEDVPPYSLALGRARQINKEGWVKKDE